MLPFVRAEFRKLLTIRSTYILSILSFLLAGFIAFWVLGYKGNPGSSVIAMEAVKNASFAISSFVAIIGILLVTHEYRYNTIMYTLTSSNSRSKILLAKIIVMVIYVVLFTIFVTACAAGLALLGAHLGHNNQVAPQVFYYGDVIWRTLYYIIAYILAALAIAFLFRHVVGAIATFLLVPSTIEGLLSLLFKENHKYLPFTALDQVQAGNLLAPGKAALVFAIYLVIGWAIAWLLFIRRDAS